MGHLRFQSDLQLQKAESNQLDEIQENEKLKEEIQEEVKDLDDQIKIKDELINNLNREQELLIID